MCSFDHPSTGRLRVGLSSLEGLTEFSQAPGDAARDRAGGDVERPTDRLVALVLREEAVEDLPAVLRKRCERLVNGERLVEQLHGLVDVVRSQLLAGELLPAAGAQPVDAEAAGELSDPGPDRLIVAKAVEMLVRAREDLLEDVLGVVLAQAEGLRADRVDVTREAADQLAPRGLVAGAAARDHTRVGKGRELHEAMKAESAPGGKIAPRLPVL